MRQLSHAAVKLSNSASDKETLISPSALSATLDCVASVCAYTDGVSCLDGNSVEPPPQLDLELPPSQPSMSASSQATLHPFFDRFYKVYTRSQTHIHTFTQRTLVNQALHTKVGDTDGFAGTPALDEEFIPIDFLQLPETVETREQAIAALRLCNRLCCLLEAQGKHVKNIDFLRVALIQHVVTELLPLPKPRINLISTIEIADGYEPSNNTVILQRMAQAGSEGCIWSAPMVYKDQIDIAILLHRLVAHFIASSFNIRHQENSFRFEP